MGKKKKCYEIMKGSPGTTYDLLGIEIIVNNSPNEKAIGDCAIRAISYITKTSWKKTFRKLSEFALEHKLMMDDSNTVVNYMVMEMGFKPINIRETHRYTSILSFIMQNKLGEYMILTDHHVTVIDNGRVVDSIKILNDSWQAEHLLADPVEWILYKDPFPVLKQLENVKEGK